MAAGLTWACQPHATTLEDPVPSTNVLRREGVGRTIPIIQVGVIQHGAWIAFIIDKRFKLQPRHRDRPLIRLHLTGLVYH